jgi:hypothetical protein
MTHRIRILVIAAGATLAALASPSIALAQTRLIATVADPMTISLRTEAGTAVTDLPAGTYSIEVRDQSINHNFHLTGPGVDERSEVETISTRTWTVTLQDRSRYRFQCDPHFASMNGSFTTGGGPPQPPPPPPRIQTLVATVGASGALSLRTSRGARVTRLKAGRYRIRVNDRSARHNFHLRGHGVNRKTGIGFRGTVTWTVAFHKGVTYRYTCDRHARHRGSFRAT